jgi:hypothetical protein
MADIRPTPEQRPIVGGLARLLETADKFARKPFGYENPPAAMVSDFLSIPPLYRTLENYAYGSPLASGTSSVSRYLPKLTADTKGAIEGAINVSPVAGPVIRGTRMATTALGKAGERLAERTVPSIMQRGSVGADLLSTLALGTTSNVIKPEGGNWIKGAAQKYVNPLRARMYDSNEAADPAMRLQSLYEKYGPEGAEEVLASGMFPHIQEKAALNRFVDKKLAKYIQNEMGTPSDSLRLQADAWADTQQKLLADKQKQIDKVRADIDRVRQERDVNPEVLTRSQARLRELQKEQDLIKNRKGIHFMPYGWHPEFAREARKSAGMPIENTAVSPVGKSWEDVTDRQIRQAPYIDQVGLSDNRVIADLTTNSPEEYEAALKNFIRESLDRLGGQYAVDNPQALAYTMNTGIPPRDVGFDHLMDELHNALLNEGMPEYLRLTPKTLDKMSVAQAAEHVDKINAWRASQRAEVDRARAANAATVVHKEYPEQGLKWVELKEPDVGDVIPEGWSEPVTKGNALQTKSVNGDVVLGESLPELIKNIYKRHPDTPGNPRAALEDALKYEGEILQHCVGGYCPDVMEGRSRIFSLRDADGRPHATIEVQPSDDYDLQKAINWKTYLELQEKDPDAAVKYAAEIRSSLPSKIKQIKGAQNRKPEAEFIPYIQDFVKSGDWQSIGDIGHADLYQVTPGQKLPGFSKEIEPGYYTLEDFQKMAVENEMPQEILDSWMNKLQKMYRYGYAEGGKKKPSPFDQLEPTFGQRMGAAAADKLTEAGLWLYDKLADRDKLSSAHKIYLDTFVHDKRDPITAKDFSPQDLAELQNLILQKEKLTGKKGAGYIKYDDYSTLPGGNQQKAKVINLFSGVLPPRAALSKALGQFNYERDPKTGQFRIIDEYDFNPQHIRVDGEKVEVPGEFYGDYVEDAGFSPYALARLYGGRKMPPGTGRKVELSVPGKAEGGLVDYDPDEIAQLAQSVVEGLAPYGVRHSGEGVKGKGYFGPMAGRDGVVTEMSAEDESGEYPLVVPTLTAAELDSLIAGEPISEEIYSKARSWADTRRARGQSPFADPTELRMPRPGYAAGGVAMQVGGIASVMKMIKQLATDVKKAEKAGDAKEALSKREQLNEAIKSAVNSPEMPRAKPLTKAEVDAYAERMAPQIAGEMTREAKGSKTIAGKSQKQFKREQTLPVDRRVMEGKVDPSAPLPIMTLEDQKDAVLLGLPGDPSLARTNLYGIGDIEFARPVGLHGGPRFGDDEKLWASNLSAATNLLNTADRASKQYGNAPVIASYMKMPSGLPFAQHYFESLLQYQRPDELTKAAKKALTDDIKAGYVDADGNRIKFPNFPGFDDLDKVAEMAQADSGLRKHIADRLEKSTKYGLRSAADVQFAVSHPELTNLETGASGFTLGELISRPLTESSHPTYSHDIAGRVLGQMQYSTPYGLLYRDQLDLIRRNPKSPEFNTLKLMGARQKIDEQLVNEVNEYQERLRQLIGKYKGGIHDAEDSVGMQVGGGVSALIKMMKRLSAEGKKTEKAADFEELIARLPKAPPEVEARVLAEIEARDRARREMYKVPEVDKTKGKKALAEARRILMTPEERAAYEAQLREQGLQSFLEPSKVKERLYHGTTAHDEYVAEEGQAFQQFTGRPTWLAEEPYTASGYSKGTGSTYPVYAQIKNPLKIGFDANDDAESAFPLARKLGVDVKYIMEMRNPEKAWEIVNHPSFIDAVVNAGYDGIQINEGGYKTYGVFSPSKIKSAIGNRGTYDITDPDITKRRGGVIKKAKGGVVDYDPAEIDTLVSQLKEEFHG